jgi:hypothetical protein
MQAILASEEAVSLTHPLSHPFPGGGGGTPGPVSLSLGREVGHVHVKTCP